MDEQLNLTEWVNSEAAKHVAPKGAANYKVTNGNVEGRFEKETVFIHKGEQFIVSAGSTFCVYGSMGGNGSAALIEDVEHGSLTVRKNGKVSRRAPEPMRPGAKRPYTRQNAPLGIG